MTAKFIKGIKLPRERAAREAGPFTFMALLAAHGGVPGVAARPVPAPVDVDFFDEATRKLGALACELRFEDYDFMDLMEEAGFVPARAFAPAANDNRPIRWASVGPALRGSLRVSLGGFARGANDNHEGAGFGPGRGPGTGPSMEPPRAA